MPPLPDAPNAEPVILLVEDDRHMRVFLKSRMAFLGAHLRMVLDGEEALEALEERHPDLIISDAVMPRMDGFEFCRQVKRVPALAALPFLLLTSLSQNVGERALEAGADDYLSKQESEPVFRLRLRLLLALGMRARAGHPQPPPGPASILVASRSQAVQTQMGLYLAKDGIETQAAASNGEVMFHLRERPASALVLDLEQGPESMDVLLGNLRSDPAFASLPVMVLASKAEEPHLEALEDRIQDRLMRPLDAREARHRVRLLLRLAQA